MFELWGCVNVSVSAGRIGSGPGRSWPQALTLFCNRTI